ncbi:MAG: SCO family protein [Amphiplicatus sp.]
MLKILGKTWGLLAAALLAACSGGAKVDVPADAVIQLSDQFSSDFALIDQNGKPTADEDFRGRVMIVYFGFATCPDVCPMALGALSVALNDLSAAERAKVAPIFITVDPERDTPEALKAYLAHDARIIALTGAPDAVAAALRSFKIFARKVPLPNSALGYTMDHSSLFYIVDKEGRPSFALRDGLTGAQLAELLRRSIKS